MGAKLREESGRSGSVRQYAQCAKRFVGAAGQTGHHLIGIDTYSFQLGDELTNYFRVRHPAPD